MEGSTKIIVAVAGVAIIGALALAKGGKPETPASSPPGLNANALAYLTSSAESAAQVAMNRDQISGATTIQAMKTAVMLTDSNNHLVAQLDAQNAGVRQAQIQDGTARAVEASRASVAKTVAKYQYKIGKKKVAGANLNSILGAVNNSISTGASILSSLYAA